MSRCKACNKILDDEESKATNHHTKEPEDLCRKCKGEAYDAALELMSDEDLEKIEYVESLMELDIYTD